VIVGSLGMSPILVTDLLYKTGAVATGMREVAGASDETESLSNRDGRSNDTCWSPSLKNIDVWEEDVVASCRDVLRVHGLSPRKPQGQSDTLAPPVVLPLLQHIPFLWAPFPLVCVVFPCPTQDLASHRI
jgi:hypothetical protein